MPALQAETHSDLEPSSLGILDDAFWVVAIKEGLA